MNKNGPIVIVEDDEDDVDLIKTVFSELHIENEVVFFKDGQEAYEGLNNTTLFPFIIISDINMPRMNGMQLRDKMQVEGELRLRTIPYLFLTTSTNSDLLITAYANSVQGFFNKSSNIQDFKRTINRIMEYWGECVSPSVKS